jgi:hypothetical protein
LTCTLGVCLGLLAVRGGETVDAQLRGVLPFSPGETLTYDVTWSVFPAGQVVATLLGPGKNGEPTYEVKTTAESKGFVSLLYGVDDEFRSFFDPNTLCSERITKRIHEGRRHKQTQINFDYARKVAVLDERDPTNPNARPKHKEESIPACVEDVVSAFYYLRNQPLEVGQEIELAVNDGSKTTEVEADVQGREQITTGLGSLTALRVEPKVFGALYPRQGRMLIWFSDDSRHLPLRIRMTISIGTITGTLASVTSSGGQTSSTGTSAAPAP